MRIEAVEIKNGCQHRAFKGEFGPGVIVIEGPNGSGKSNLIKLIVRGLTGLAMNFGKKEDDLTFSESQGYVKVDFSVAGQKGSIMRSLKNASCKMSFGGRDYKTAKEIDEAIYTILGVSPKVMVDIVMAQQGKIESVLFQTPADRARSMQELFGTLQAEKLREILAEDMANTPVASRADTIRQLEDGLRVNVVGPRAKAQEDLEATSKHILASEVQAYHEEIVRNFDVQEANKTALETATREEKEGKERLDKHNARLSDLVKLSSDNLVVINDLRPLAQTLAEKISSAGENKRIKTQRDEAIRQLQECTQKLAVSEPQQPCDPIALETARKNMNHLQHTADNIRSMLQNIGGQSTCPTCKQPVSPSMLEEKDAELKTVLSQLGPLEAAVRKSDEALSGWTRTYARWKAETDQARTMHARLQDQISKLPEVTIPSDTDLALDKQTVEDFNALERTQAGTQADIANMTSFGKVLAEEYAKVKERLAAAHKCQAAAGDRTVYQVSKAALEQHHKASLAAAALQGRIESLDGQFRNTTSQLATLKNEEAKLEKVKEWRDLLEKARQCLHRDQLPNLVAQSYIRSLNGRLAKYLDMFDVPYTCKIAADMGVICAFSGNRQLPAERLSGGEKVMLGIAFRFAVYDLFASNLGLLILDEPTVFLDDDRIDSVYELLEKVKSYSKSAGLQLIVITHEKRLAGVADKVISL